MRVAVLLGSSLASLGAALASPLASNPINVFACSIGANQVSITATGDRLVFRFGRGREDDILIAGVADDVFWMEENYTGHEQQIRFRRREFSYIAYSIEGNVTTEERPVSGLVLKKNALTLYNSKCSSFSRFDSSFDHTKLRKDTEPYSASGDP